MSEKTSEKHSARETVFDVGVEQLARVYAQAILDAAGDRQAQAGLMEELREISTEILQKHPALQHVFGSVLISQEEKIEMLDRIFGNQLSQIALSSLKILARHGRLGILRHVIRSAEKLWAERNNLLAVELELAQEVDSSLKQQILATLSKFFQGEPTITTRVNPDLIAGFVARVGDKVYDASTRTNLEKVRRSMLANAIEMIQSHPRQYVDMDSASE